MTLHDDKLSVQLASARKSRRKIRSRTEVRRQANFRTLFHSSRQGRSRPRQGNLDAGRSGRHAPLHSHLRLSERSNHVRNDSHRARRLAHRFQRKAAERAGCAERAENLDLAAIPAGFHVPDFLCGRRIHRKEGYLAQHSGYLQRPARDRRHHRADIPFTPRKCWTSFRSDSAWPIPGISTRKRRCTISWRRAWKT